MLRLKLILLLAAATSCLHLSENSTAGLYNATNYLSGLESRQAKFRSDINNIKSQIDAMNKALNDSTLSAGQQLKTLNEGMAEQRDNLYNIETYLNMPFQAQPCRKCNLTAEQKQQLQKQADAVSVSLDGLSKEVDFCPECPQIQQIKKQVQKEYNYLKVIQAALQTDCLKRPYEFQEENSTGLVNLANSLYKDNLKAPNWIYGNTTQQQYKMDLFARSTQYNLTSCPLSRPFVDFQQKICVPCVGVFDLGKRQCAACPNGTHYDSTSGKCVSTPINCTNGTRYDPATAKCVEIPISCPNGTRLNPTKKACQSICSQYQFFNKTSQKCQENKVNCTAGFAYNETTHNCSEINCPPGKAYDVTIKQCIDKVENTIALCPPTRPFWNSVSIKCQACPSQQPFYNKIFNRCEGCDEHEFWNTTTHSCQHNTTITNITCPAARPLLNNATKKCQACPSGLSFNAQAKQCQRLQCPEGYSLTNQSKCIKCPDGYVFEAKKLQCVPCLNNTYFDLVKKICIACTANSKEPACQKCPEGAFFNATTSQCMRCPNGTTYDKNSSKCFKSCQPGFYISPTSQDCKAKPKCPQGQYFQIKSEVCKSCPIDTFYNASTQNCYKCGKGTMYDNTTRTCIAPVCGAKQYFSAASNKCLVKPNCSSGQYFDIKTEKCVDEPVCKEGQYFDHWELKCLTIPTCRPDEYFNKKAGKCSRADYLTSPNAPNLIYAYSIEEYRKQYQQRKKDDQFAKDCPADTPYFDMNRKVCVKCPESAPLFNLHSSQCQDCGSGKYDSQQRRCLNDDRVEPTLERLIMNIL